MENEVLRMTDVTKIYPNGVIANKDVSFSLKKGEIHALMGENGAGKTTLMKILFGIEECNSGEILYDGRNIGKKTPEERIKLGIGMVHQHFTLVDSLRVYENVVLGMEPKKGLFIDKKAAIDMVGELSETYNLNVDPHARISDISVGLRQKVEILKVLARGAMLLILDEPTAVLTPQETKELFQQLLLLKESGRSIIFISHKIREVMEICDRITVLRDGKLIQSMKVVGINQEDVSRSMVGRSIILKADKGAPDFGEKVLSVRDLTYSSSSKKVLKNISFDLHKGQILGVAAVEGNGQNELAESIFGLREGAHGEVLLEGENILGKSIKDIRANSVSYIPEDRLAFGIAKEAAAWENLISDRIDSPGLKSKGFLSPSKIRHTCKELIKDFDIRCKNEKQSAEMLSGGNIQKIVVAREFSSNPNLLLANQPTRGVDVGSNEFVWQKIIEKRDEGKGVLLISADLNEILELSDSIMVMCNGEVAAFFQDSASVTEEELGLYMLGIKKQKVTVHEQ